jgi:hypothetical protein
MMGFIVLCTRENTYSLHLFSVRQSYHCYLAVVNRSEYMPTDEERFKYECWAVVQELDPDDIADAIQDSVALVEAIKANHAEDVASIVMNRVELKVRRRAELRVFDVVKTPWVDDIEELQAYRNLRIERVQKALEERKIMEAKMDGPFQQMFDE